MFLFQALHKISLRENVCTQRVCELLLNLASTLIDLGVLANNQSRMPLAKSMPSTTSMAGLVPEREPAPGDKTKDKSEAAGDEKDEDKERKRERDREGSGDSTPTAGGSETPVLTVHNTFMDIVIR